MSPSAAITVPDLPRVARPGACRSLERLLAERERSCSVADAVAVGVQLCEALALLHREGAVHGQVVPSRVLVARASDGVERVDLVASSEGPEGARFAAFRPDVGSPGSLSPEYLLALKLDERSDVYGVGAVLFECLTGRPPYVGEFEEVLQQVGAVEGGLPDLVALRPDVPRELAAVVTRALERRRSRRPADVAALCAALRAAVPMPSIRTHLFGPPPAPPASARGPAVAPSGDAAERRRTPRAPYVAPVCVLLDGAAIHGRSEDISEEGILVVTRGLAPQACRPGARARVRFALPIEGRVADAEAVVRWVRPAGGLFSMGLELLDAPAAVCESVRRYVRLMGDRLAPPIAES
jgi:hypothetical protein